MTDVKTGKVLVVGERRRGRARARHRRRGHRALGERVQDRDRRRRWSRTGVGPNTRQCYSGGEHQIRAVDLVDDKKRDKWCATMTQAMGRSLNAVFARLAAKNLDRDKLGAVAGRYGYNQDLPFDVKIAPSTLTFPDDDLGFARTAAGFWNSTLSPFEGANIATTVANGGEMVRLYVVSSVKDEAGEIYKGPTGRQVVRRVMDESTASQITTMMENTVESGTSYRSFHDRNGRPYLPEIRVAGKTGTLDQARAGRAVLHVVRRLRAQPQARGRDQRDGREPPQVAREGDERRLRHAARLLRRQGRARREGSRAITTPPRGGEGGLLRRGAGGSR